MNVGHIAQKKQNISSSHAATFHKSLTVLKAILFSTKSENQLKEGRAEIFTVI